MDADSLSFGADGAGGTPDADSILAQPPLQESPSAQEESTAQGEGQAAEGMHLSRSIFLSGWSFYVITPANTRQHLMLP